MKAILLYLLLAFPLLVFGHEGHGIPVDHPLHYFTSWIHLAPLLPLILFDVLYRRHYLRRSNKIFKRNHA